MAAARTIGKVLPRCRGLLGSRALSSGSGDSNDVNFDAMFADVPPSSNGQGKAASSQDGKGYWQTLLKEPSTQKAATPANWDFLHELTAANKKPRWGTGSSSSSSSGPSFRNVPNSGIDFLTDDFERPAPTQRELASRETQSEEESVIQAASFKLLRDSFRFSPTETRRYNDRKATTDESLGFDTRDLYASSEVSRPKAIDSRTLSEVEENFYSTMGESPLESKTYTYEELGEKLSKVRPPKEQILHSATGLSFGELRVRFEMIDQEVQEEGESQSANYRDLKESLFQLRDSSYGRKPLTHEELMFVNSTGLKRPGVRIEYTPPNDDLLTKYYSEAQLSSKERLKLEIKKLKEEFQTHEYDSGSPQVQIAILTARINNLNRHMREGRNYKRDKHSKKGLSDMVQYRRRLLRYLRRRDWPVYCNVLTKLKLEDVILEKRR